MGRVWLSVQATAASLEATRLRESIKYERYKGDMLEVRQSALGSPDRIRTIAGAAMNMAPAGKVTYLDLSDGERACATPAASRVSAAGEDLGDVVSQVLNLTAGEAQVLLVGDVGLAATR
jgi:tripartite-type tricarboxylate transporter receptor subunit TctC